MATETKEKQQRMEGTYDKPVKAVTEKAEEYADVLRERMALQVRENSLREELIDVMKKHNVETVDLEGEIVSMEHVEAKDKIKVKAKPEIED